LVSARVENTRKSAAGAYTSPDELLDDLITMRDVLVTARATALADDALLDLIYRVRCFGFALAKLDVREDARVHRRAIAELLGDPSYPERSDEERIAALRELNLPAKGATVSAETRRWLDLFDGLRRILVRFGDEPLGAYVVTMTESTADVLEVKRVAELYGIDRNLDFVPLFESRAALLKASEIVRGLLENHDYRAHVARRGEHQEILVGYSDSMKEAGILTSRALLLDAQREVLALCRAQGVRMRVFHGRGGSLSRGGGPAYRGIRALPANAFSADLKITEQGETRAAHFANPDLAARYLEQTLSAVLASEVEARRSSPVLEDRYAATLAKLAERSFVSYRDLVDDPALLQFFWEATPIEAIGTLNMGSRPAKRGKEAPNSLADLRAIPWVFAWSQSRAVITGWYGVGSALEAVLAEDGLELLREMYRESPFVRDLFDNVQMTLAKADLPIAERYAKLSTDREGGARVSAKIAAEFARTGQRLLEISGERELLAGDPVIQRSIRLRNPYVDPLSYLQIEALMRVRSAIEGEQHDSERELWRRLARVAVQGIAAGVRNTG
jgi:phosphoenolpyruvate carboxylase